MTLSASENIDRRRLFSHVGAGLAAAGVSGTVPAIAMSGDTPTVASTGPHFPARAKRVIHLFMNGGPFQADLFDPKPSLLKYAGQKPEGADLLTERPTGGLLPSPFRFRPRGESGVQVSELLPKLSQHIDDICVLRSMHADNPNHGPALLQMNNGTIIPTRPSMGAWFLYGLGTGNWIRATSFFVRGAPCVFRSCGTALSCRLLTRERTSIIRRLIRRPWFHTYETLAGIVNRRNGNWHCFEN